MNNNIKRFSYEDTDKKIEIELYGIVFEINKEAMLNKDLKDLKNKENNEDLIETELEEVLGKNSIERINNQREKDGYKKMTIDIELSILGFVYQTFIQASANNVLQPIEDGQNELQNKIQNFNENRQYRRKNYRKNYRRY